MTFNSAVLNKHTRQASVYMLKLSGFLLGVKMTECTKCRQTREKAKTVAKMASEALSKPQMIFKAQDRLKTCAECVDITRWYGFMQGTDATVTVKDKCKHKSGNIVDYVSNGDSACPMGKW